MRYIAKSQQSCHQLKQKNTPPPQSSKEAGRRWSGFKNKSALLDALLKEQLKICCYSELSAENYGYGYHVEHVLNKSQYPRLTFEYANLAASALSSSDLSSINKACGKAAFGGHAIGKSQAVDKKLFITPHKPGCERFFYYLSSGEVVPAIGLNTHDSARAKYTIECLNLNSQFLIRERKSWWDELNDLIIDAFPDSHAIQKLADLYAGKSSGAICSFYSMTLQMFGKIGKGVK
ncbi:TIGR02646 family protein [Pseudomonas atacamensis]|uniref:TIGR02646 family protein n=1 Tax=Pseudomonas atacamensis TaxID=2565368 RepID=A0AAQ2D7M4_9PSED|nr:retron system putative HNH endonuclease [Pseudomonas atacamensis]THF26953.1 TIGR02646 family protein [Pseudomonas atacamensis]